MGLKSMMRGWASLGKKYIGKYLIWGVLLAGIGYALYVVITDPDSAGSQMFFRRHAPPPTPVQPITPAPNTQPVTPESTYQEGMLLEPM